MSKFVFAAAALVAAAPVLAAPVTQSFQFQRDGVRYEVTMETLADGSQRLTGRDLTHNRPFALNVVNGQVSGTFGEDAVNYPAPRRSARATAVSYQR